MRISAQAGWLWPVVWEVRRGPAAKAPGETADGRGLRHDNVFVSGYGGSAGEARASFGRYLGLYDSLMQVGR